MAQASQSYTCDMPVGLDGNNLSWQRKFVYVLDDGLLLRTIQ